MLFYFWILVLKWFYAIVLLFPYPSNTDYLDASRGAVSVLNKEYLSNHILKFSRLDQFFVKKSLFSLRVVYLLW